MEEPDERAWSIVRQQNVHEGQGKKGVQDSSKISRYVAKTRALKKAQEKKLDVAEMRKLQWMRKMSKMARHDKK